MSDETWTIVKVGGSLFDLPDLGPRLRAWLVQLNAPRVLLVPGGGGVADAVRALDRTHHLGEETSHWLAIEAMSINARFLNVLLPEASVVAHIPTESMNLHILDALPFFRADDVRQDHLPHNWQVTSDSLAVRVAMLAGTRQLILLKSVDCQGGDWNDAIRAGIVDGYFADAVRLANSGVRFSEPEKSHDGTRALRIGVVNLRT